MLSDAFYNGEIEAVQHSREYFHAFQTDKFNCDDVKDIIEKFDKSELYSHECGELGGNRGCLFLHVMDGETSLPN